MMPRSASLKSWRQRNELLELQEMEKMLWTAKIRNLSVRALPSDYDDEHLSVYMSSSLNTSIDRIPEVRFSRFTVQRDYSVHHTAFFDDMPAELYEMLVEPHIWERTIKEINVILERATKTSFRTVYETVTSFATCYLVNIFRQTYYEKCLHCLRCYILYQNMTEYMQKGLKIQDPSLNGFRYLEFVVLDQELVKARYDEDMLSQKLDPKGKKHNNKKWKSDDLFEDPQPGTTASFGIPRITVPADELPVGPEACHGVHEMHFVVPELDESAIEATESPTTPSLDGRASRASSSSWYSTNQSFERKSGTSSSASSWYSTNGSLNSSIESLNRTGKYSTEKVEALIQPDTCYFHNSSIDME